MSELQPVLEIVQSLGVWAIFLFLYLQERKEHNESRKYYESKIEILTKSHMDDLRDLIGIRQSLASVQSTVKDFKLQQPPVTTIIT